MLKRLKIKFVAVIMLVVTLLLAVIFVLTLSFTKAGAVKESLGLMKTAAEESLHPVKPDLPKNTEQPEGAGLPQNTEQPGLIIRSGSLLFVMRISPSGEISADGSSDFDLTDESFLRELAETVSASKEQTGVIREYDLRYLCAPGRIVFADISRENAIIENLAKTCGLICGVSLLLFFGVSILLAGWAVKPVEKAWEQQRQFISDASHELKTPLTVIMTNAQLLNEENGISDSCRGCTEAILKMSGRMKGLTESLLELARIDEGRLNAFESLDFSGLVSEAVLPFEPLFYENGLVLETEIDTGITLFGDRIRLSQAAEILLDNALKYSLPEKAVRLSLKRQGGSCILSVSGCGDPISKENLKNIFKRFYRIDKARSGESYGLGLPIAAGIAESHKGKIWAQSEGGVNCFYIKLPVIAQK
ncbi:MAG: sensor histidine kinase [Ruminiclostridium sp.]